MTELNERQQHYLKAARTLEAQTEAYREAAAAKGQWDRTPAKEWRRMHFGPYLLPSKRKVGESPLRKLCQPHVDSGAGSTWQALEDRGLVEMSYESVKNQLTGQMETIVYVTLTRKGRKLARELLGEVSTRPPKGVISWNNWQALKLVVEQGEVKQDPGAYTHGGINSFVWHNVCVFGWATEVKGVYRPTEEGRKKYDSSRAANEKWYSEVEES